jgi:opacity protein-like surface antigen
MRQYCAVIILAFLLPVSCAFSQEQLYSVSFFGSYTTSSKLYYDPNDPNDILRAQNLPIERILGYGFDIRRSFEESGIQIGLSVERIAKTEIIYQPIDASSVIPVYDGYVAIPVELTGYFIIPFSNETAQMYMGGGGGAYWGVRQYEMGGVTARVVERSTGFGIHVLSGFQYNFCSTIAIRCEVKFRDVQFKSTNQFNSSIGLSGARTVTLSSQPFDSRISIDGMGLAIGLAYRF